MEVFLCISIYKSGTTHFNITSGSRPFFQNPRFGVLVKSAAPSSGRQGLTDGRLATKLCKKNAPPQFCTEHVSARTALAHNHSTNT